MRKLWWAALCAAGVVALAGQAGAAVVTISQTIDVNSHDPLLNGSSYSFGPGSFTAFAPVTVGLGDQLDVTVHFQPGQTLTLLNVNQVTLSVIPFSFGTTIFGSVNPTLNFLGADGLPFGAATVPNSNISNISIPAEAGYTGPITISGLHFVASADSVVFGPGTLDTFSTVQGLGIIDYGIGSAAVPEPANWALMIAGFGVAGAALRRRRAVAA